MITAATAVCAACGLPVRVEFDAKGATTKVFAVCGHVQTTTYRR